DAVVHHRSGARRCAGDDPQEARDPLLHPWLGELAEGELRARLVAGEVVEEREERGRARVRLRRIRRPDRRLLVDDRIEGLTGRPTKPRRCISDFQPANTIGVVNIGCTSLRTLSASPSCSNTELANQKASYGAVPERRTRAWSTDPRRL